MLLLQQTFPLLFDIVSIVEGDQLPEALTAFIIDLLEKAKSPFSRNGSIPDAVQLDVHRINDVEYYPCLPVVRSRGDYCLDDTTPNICTKGSTQHPFLLPGVFLVHCKQGITYGLNVMLCNKSTNIPFTVFQMHFSQGPRPVVYHKSCNLHLYCLNQDPVFFKNSQFLVDQLHWLDHTVNSDMCRLCFQGPDEEIFGKFLKDIDTGFSVHQYCMFLSSGLAQRGKDDEEFDGFLIKDIKKEISRAKRLKHAKSSGLYYFRCPVCNNLEEFQEEMKRMGIFIPDQDASWETEDAFVDLLFQYSRCDAKNCVCPNGREYKETSGKWRLRLCDTCGQTGTHLKCQRWKKSPGEWHCHVCGHSEPQLSTRQRQIGDHSMNYLSHDDDDDAWESPTEDCEVNVCSVSDDEPPLAEIRNELNCRRETTLPEDTVVKKPNMGSSPMRKRLRISLQRSDDEDETIEQKGERTIELQETPDFSGLHLGDSFASTSSMTSSVLLTLSGLITGSARENLQNEFELIGKESIESDCSSDASVEFVKAVKTDKEHFDSEANVDRSAPVLPNTRSAQCGKVLRRACFREVKQDLSSTTSKAVMDFVEAESCIISVRTEGRESTSVVNFSVAENKEDSDEDSCCITKVVRKLCPFGNDKCGLKCDLDCCNSVVRHIYQSPSPSAVSMGSYVHKDLQSKTFDSSSTCGSTSHVKRNKGKPVDKNKLFDTTTTEAVEEDRASFISVGTNTLPFKPCVKKDSLHKVAPDAATTQRKRIKLSTKKSSKRLKRFAAVQDEKVALSHKC